MTNEDVKCCECGEVACYSYKDNKYCYDCALNKCGIEIIAVERCRHCGVYVNPELVFVIGDDVFCSDTCALAHVGCESI